MVDYSSQNSSYRSYEKHGDEYSPHVTDTLRILKEEIRSCKENNDIIIQEQEKQAEVNAFILQVLSYLQRKGPIRINHGQEDMINGAYGSRSDGRHKSDRDDMVIDGMFLDTLDMRGDGQRFYSSFGSHKHHGHHHYHPYTRNEKGYFPYELRNPSHLHLMENCRSQRMKRHGSLGLRSSLSCMIMLRTSRLGQLFLA